MNKGMECFRCAVYCSALSAMNDFYHMYGFSNLNQLHWWDSHPRTSMVWAVACPMSIQTQIWWRCVTSERNGSDEETAPDSHSREEECWGKTDWRLMWHSLKSLPTPEPKMFQSPQRRVKLEETWIITKCHTAIVAEGPEKAIRGGGEWKLIKISHRNLAYISKPIRRPSLLTRLRPHSYNKAIGLQNQVRDRSGNMKQC
jgi:hypothetical protein